MEEPFLHKCLHFKDIFTSCQVICYRFNTLCYRIWNPLWEENKLFSLEHSPKHDNTFWNNTTIFFFYLCKSICLFDPSSFFCFDTLLLTESADELESSALFLPRPAPLVGVPFSVVPEAAAADLGGRPRRLTGGVSISALGAAF